MSEWQTIATAPKDGTWILGYIPGLKSKIYIIKWIDEWWWNPVEGLLYDLNQKNLAPTHWAPIPSLQFPTCSHEQWMVRDRDRVGCAYCADCETEINLADALNALRMRMEQALTAITRNK